MADVYSYQQGFGEPPTSEEELLLAHLKRIRTDPTGYFAVHIHLSKLRPGNRQPHFISLAAKTFEAFTQSNEAVLFPLYNADFVLVCHDVPIDDVDPIIEKVRTLFPEDPLTAAPVGSYEDRFTTWYDLSQADDVRAFQARAEEFAAAAEAHREEERRQARERTKAADEGTPLAPDNLAAINQRLRTTQVADLIRNQAVYRVVPGTKGEILFREYFIAMADLKNRVAPNVNLFGSPWLFQYLTETLDRRMLAVMGRRDLSGHSTPISLNLNLGTITSRDFQQFHAGVGEGNASRIYIELQVIDIFADLTTFNHVRDMLQEHGYKVLIDGLNPLSIHYFDPIMLRADYLKITWGPEFVGEERDEKMDEVRAILRHAGTESVILSRVDTQEAVAWGASLGISRYQGYFIDKLVAAMRRDRGERARAPEGAIDSPEYQGFSGDSRAPSGAEG